MNLTGIDWPNRLKSARRQLQGVPRAEGLTDLVEMIALPAQRAPQAVAVCLCCHGRPAEVLTWGQLWSSACRQADQFRRAGLQPGERVLLALPTSRDFLSCFFAAILSGGIPVPTAPPTSRRAFHPHLETLRNIARDSGSAFFVASASGLDYLKSSLQSALPGVRFLAPGSSSDGVWKAPADRPRPSDTALLQYTSGSTSQPKGVELSHRALLANIRAIVDQVIPPQTVGLSWLPLHHDMGLIGCLLTNLAGRVPLVLMPPSAFVKNPAIWLRGISEFKATISVAPNFAYQHCLDQLDVEGLAGVRLDSLQVMLNGAEPVQAEVIERFEHKFRWLGLKPGVVRSVYGLAENSLAVTFSGAEGLQTDQVDADIMECQAKASPARPGCRRRCFVSVGRPLPGQRLKIVDESGNPLADRRVGSILVQGPSMMKGYFNRPQESAGALRNGWLCTGDLGYLAGGRLFVTGRSKEIIIRHGRNYFPHDVEGQLARVSGVYRGGAAAFSVEAEGREKVIVVVETRLRRSAQVDRLDRLIRQRVHEMFLFGPDELLLVRPGSIPRTTSGKVQYWKCRRDYLNGALQQRRAMLETGKAREGRTEAGEPKRKVRGTGSSPQFGEGEIIGQAGARSHRHRLSNHQDA